MKKKVTSIGQELRTIIAEKNMNTTDFAKKTQIPEVQIKWWISGQSRPQMADLPKIAAGLGMTEKRLKKALGM